MEMNKIWVSGAIMINFKLCNIFLYSILWGLNAGSTDMSYFTDDSCMELQFVDDNNSLGHCSFGDFKNIEFLTIPQRVLNWGSQGRLGRPWIFKDKVCNDDFIKLQHRIALNQKGILETPHDLFHAHIINFGHKSSGLALIFHAKEYPYDIEFLKNRYQMPQEKFYSTDNGFKNRNFLYVNNLEQGQKAAVYLVKNEGRCRELFSEHGLNSLDEIKVAQILKGSVIGDFNIFNKDEMKRLKYTNYSDELGDEARDSGLSPKARGQINDSLDSYTNSLGGEKIIYFLTGK